MNKKNILIAVLAALVISSGLLIYRGFSSQPLSLVATPTVSSQDVDIKRQVDAVMVKITKAISKIDTGGPLDALIESRQFQELSADLIRPIADGVHGRGNPFLPLQTPPAEPAP